MNCFETQNLIMQYINNELSGARLEGFLKHIDSCSSCKEELEIYYTMLTGIKQLDEDKLSTNNFHLAFEKQLTASRKKLERHAKGYVRKLVIIDILALAPIFLMSGDMCSDEYNHGFVYTTVKESNYYYDVYKFKSKNEIDGIIEERLDDINRYIEEQK